MCESILWFCFVSTLFGSKGCSFLLTFFELGEIYLTCEKKYLNRGQNYPKESKMDGFDTEKLTKETFGEFEIDLERRRLTRNGEKIPLYAKGFDLLTYMIANRGRTVTKQELLEAVWPDQFVEEANLSVQFSALRKALGEDRKDPRFLITVPGIGYRFSGESPDRPDSIVIERERITEIVAVSETIQTEFGREGKAEGALDLAKQSRLQSRVVTIGVVAAFSVLLITSGYFVYRSWSYRPTVPFGSVKVSQVTNTGDVAAATLSPDGKFVSYVRSTREGNSLWMQQTEGANALEIVPATPAEYWGVTFSPDGKYVYYNLFVNNRAELELHRVPALGGREELVANNITGAISFSPNGDRIAFIQPDSTVSASYLMTAKPDGSDKKIASFKPQPSTFLFEGRSTSWSPDGRFIATIVNNFRPDSNFASVVIIDIDLGTERIVGEKNWHEITRVEWLKDGDHILIAARPERNDPRQIWLLSVSGSQSIQITNDLNDHSSIQANADGDSLISVQSSAEHGIYVGKLGESENEFVNVISETTEVHPIEWPDEESILFRSSRDGSPNLWSIRPDGTERRQLTVAAEVDFRGFCKSLDGRYLVYTSWRSGRSNIWRANADGSGPMRLTDGEADAYPVCLPDSNSVVFQRGIFSKPEINKVRIDGSNAERIRDRRGKWPSLMADGGISAFRMSGNDWVVYGLDENGTSSKEVVIPEDLKGSRVVWQRDGSGFIYTGAEGNVGNLWLMTHDGKKNRLTEFNDRWIDDFAINPSGKYAAVVRTKAKSDVILIRNK